MSPPRTGLYQMTVSWLQDDSKRRSVRAFFVVALAAVALVLSGVCALSTCAFAATTGSLNGRLVDDSGKPVAGATVTAQSPSQTATVSSDSSGHFSFVSLAPDTYTVLATKDNYASALLAGVTVIADNMQTLEIHTSATKLKTIVTVVARSSSLVQPGTTVDVYSVNALQAQLVAGLGGGGSLNSAYSSMASVPGVFVPQGQSGWAQSVFIRGSDYTQVGYEFDGVPIQRAFDLYPSSALSSLGQQELQVYTGSAPADAQSATIGGYVNQIIKMGTFPGFATGEMGVGTPTFYHKLQFEAGGSEPNRLFSYYMGIAGYNQNFRYASQFNGADLDSQYGTLYNVVAQGCGTANPSAGCYVNSAGVFGIAPLGPNGYAFGPFSIGSASSIADREAVANLHFALPHKRDPGRDDIQFLYDISYLKTEFPVAFNDWNYARNDVLNGTATYNGALYPNCANVSASSSTACAILPGIEQTYVDTSVYTGNVGVKLMPGSLGSVSPYLQPGSPTQRQFNAQTPLSNRDFTENNASIVKLQYQNDIGTSAFFRIYAYASYSNWLQDSLSGATINEFFVGAVNPDYELSTRTTGAVGSFVDQVNAKNLLEITGGYTRANTLRFNNQWYAGPTQIAVAVDSSNPTSGICYGVDGHGNPSAGYCGGVRGAFTPYQYVLPPVGGGSLIPKPITVVDPATGARSNIVSPDINAIGGQTCGTGPCEYFVVQNGNNGPYNTVTPVFTNISLEDTWKPADRLTFNLGLHYDDFRYLLPDTTVAPTIGPPGSAALLLWQNSFNAFYCYSNAQGLYQTKTANGCPAADKASWSNASPPANDYRALEPRFGFTVVQSPQTVYRFSFGRFEQPAYSAFQQYQNASFNLAAAPSSMAFYGYGFHNPAHAIYPQESLNTDFSWERHVQGIDVSWKLTPFLRTTHNELAFVLLDPKTGFVSGLNVGNKVVSGFEFQIQKGDFARDGLSGFLNYTYTHGTIKFSSLPSGVTVLDNINRSIAQYNAYTSFCANRPSDSKCSIGGIAILPTNGKTASPCYDNTGAPVACASMGAIANPYWNGAPQPFLNAADSFVPYNRIPNAGAGSVASSYIIPHVATLVFSYKRGRFRLTPTIQAGWGGQYGSPVVGFGIDPAGGCAALAKVPLVSVNDPRYPNGSAGGAPYDASTCAGGIITPDLTTRAFDTFGAFREPTQITAGFQVAYEATPRITLSLLGVNLYNGCFGGTKMPWLTNHRTGCWYTSGVQYTGNFYNPGDRLQPFTAQPYQPSVSTNFTDNFQNAYGTQANPFQLYISAQVKL